MAQDVDAGDVHRVPRIGDYCSRALTRIVLRVMVRFRSFAGSFKGSKRIYAAMFEAAIEEGAPFPRHLCRMQVDWHPWAAI